MSFEFDWPLEPEPERPLLDPEPLMPELPLPVAPLVVPLVEPLPVEPLMLPPDPPVVLLLEPVAPCSCVCWDDGVRRPFALLFFFVFLPASSVAFAPVVPEVPCVSPPAVPCALPDAPPLPALPDAPALVSAPEPEPEPCADEPALPPAL
jgi:hypothetical protein